MIKYKGLIMALCFFGVLAFSATSASAGVIHDAMYYWYATWYEDGDGGYWGGPYGTRVDQDKPYKEEYTIGDTSGTEVIQIWEKVWDGEQLEYPEGTAKFRWVLANDEFDEIFSFHVLSWAFEPIVWGSSLEAIFDHDGTYYSWEAPPDVTKGLGPGEDIVMWVVVPTQLWDISNAGVNLRDRKYIDGDGYWRTSHPVPEPISLLLLGGGMLGFALLGAARKRRFRRCE